MDEIEDTYILEHQPFYTFIKTKSDGWYIKLTNEHDIHQWEEKFVRRFFEMAVTNLFEGKEYGNDGLSHGPYCQASQLSFTAYFQAKNMINNGEIIGFTVTELAIMILYRLRKSYIKTLKATVESQPVYVNRKLGYSLTITEDNILDTVCDHDFPPPETL